MVNTNTIDKYFVGCRNKAGSKKSKFRLYKGKEIMFTADALIDTVQTGKKTFVNALVTNEKVKDAMIEFIDAQADYTKKAVKVTTDAVTTVASEAVKQAQEAMKFDYAKAYAEFFKPFQPAKAK